METSFSPFLVQAFSVNCKLIFQQIPHSGEWKLIFWLAETIQYLKYPFHWNQFFHLLEVYFKWILHYSQWQGIFFLFLLDETVFLIFFQILIRMEVAFRSSKIAFFKEYFILASGNRCSINYKLCRFIWIFFSWWTQFLKLGANQFFSIFSIPNSGRSFRASGNHYSK